MNKPLTKKEWLAYLDKAIKEFDWDEAFEEPPKEKYQYGTPLLDAMTKEYVPPQRTWNELTFAEVKEAFDKHVKYLTEDLGNSGLLDFAIAIERTLKEKNGC